MSLNLEEARVDIILEEHIREHSPWTIYTKNSKETGCWFPFEQEGLGTGRKVERVENGMRIR